MGIWVSKLGGREVFIGAPCDAGSISAPAPFAVLVAASHQKELEEILGITAHLLVLGCKEICCLGLMAESLHDQLDMQIEDAGMLDVVTTWHEDDLEGCEYFLFAAGGMSLLLYGLVSPHPHLLETLALAAQDA